MRPEENQHERGPRTARQPAPRHKTSDFAAFEIIGKTSEADMAWMAEQVDQAFELHGIAAAWQWIDEDREALRA
jgi:hypothetical protein